MSEIIKLPRPSTQELSELKEIFFESSTKKDFSTAEEKSAFFEKYLGIYLKLYPNFFWVARKDGKILGYMAGAPETLVNEIAELQQHLLAFKDAISSFPAHLHVNMHHESRGLGLGAKLFSALEAQFQGLGIRGVHVMTGVNSRNRDFYGRLGFTYERVLTYQGSQILFLGKSLTDQVKKT